jgi:hypothetical protein
MIGAKIRELVMALDDQAAIKEILFADAMGEKDEVTRLLIQHNIATGRGRSGNPPASVISMTRRYLANRMKKEVEDVPNADIAAVLTEALTLLQ